MRIEKIALLICGITVAGTSFSNQRCQQDNLAATTPSRQFVVNENGTVTDTETDLMWQRCLVGQIGNQCEKGTPAVYSWGGALIWPAQFNKQEKFAGYSDWRLPNIRELSTLVELQCAQPAINLSVFPNSPASHLWSSSPYQFYPHYSWYLDFDSGVYTYGDRTDSNKNIRLVRNDAPAR